MITFIPHHVPFKSQANQGSFVRVRSLVAFVNSLPGGTVFVPSRRCFDYVSGLLLILAKVRFTKNKIILFSYPNLPFFDTNIINYFFFNIFIKLVKRLALRYHKKIILDVDDVPSISEAYLSKWPLPPKLLERRKIMEKRLFDIADVIWVITKNQAKIMSELYGLAENKFVAAPNGNARSKIGPSLPDEGKIRLVFAGAFFLTGIKEMIGSFNRLKTTRPAELYLLGPYAKWLKKFLKELNDPRIHYLGSLDSQSCEAIVKSCQVGLLTYDPNEKYWAIAHPVKLSLYITCGLPIISTNVKNIAELITQSRIGLVSPTYDMTAPMRQLVENDEMRQQMAANCAKIKEDYYFDTIYNKALELSLEKLGMRR
ncbi:MAG: glycosyltransferase [Candidatus Margulisbacteria bacterium]|nr:glycosyltransferase [Candidatus Margulisiibacteriota bacterium]